MGKSRTLLRWFGDLGMEASESEWQLIEAIELKHKDYEDEVFVASLVAILSIFGLLQRCFYAGPNGPIEAIFFWITYALSFLLFIYYFCRLIK